MVREAKNDVDSSVTIVDIVSILVTQGPVAQSVERTADNGEVNSSSLFGPIQCIPQGIATSYKDQHHC